MFLNAGDLLLPSTLNRPVSALAAQGATLSVV